MKDEEANRGENCTERKEDKLIRWKRADSKRRIEKSRRAKEKTWQQTSGKQFRNVDYELFAVGGIWELEIQRKW